MQKGAENHNWFSLSINAYIKECWQQIENFNEMKTKVLQTAQNIEKNVKKIEDTQLIWDIDWERQQPMDIVEFIEYFEGHR